METDRFNGVTNKEFIDYFKIDLHSRMEIINYTYPHELLDEDSGFGEHVHRCIGLLKDYIIVCHREAESARREQVKQALENDGKPDTEKDFQQMELVQETPEEKKQRLEIEKKQEQLACENKYGELREEIGMLIDEHYEKVKIIYVDL